MKIILSPAKRMRIKTDELDHLGLPEYLQETKQLLEWMREKSYEELKALWKCNDNIARQNVERLKSMEPEKDLTPAVLAYEGLAFQYMAPSVFEEKQLDYLQKHLRILSGFYGVLKPMDGVTPYRLEMQARGKIGANRHLYEFWGRKLYDSVAKGEGCRGKEEKGELILNLASKEYSRCVEPYLEVRDRFLTVTFCEKAGEKLITKGTYAKMARGEMVRYMAEHQVEEPEALKKFGRLDFRFREELSSAKEYVFERQPQKQTR